MFTDFWGQSRRFIIFSLAEPIKIDRFEKIDKRQFWGQVFNLYKKTKWSQIHWTRDQIKAIEENNLNYEYSNNEYETILKYFQMIPLNQYDSKNKNHKWMSATDIFLFIHEKYPQFKIDVRWIGSGLVSLKFERRGTNASGK